MTKRVSLETGFYLLLFNVQGIEFGIRLLNRQQTLQKRLYYESIVKSIMKIKKINHANIKNKIMPDSDQILLLFIFFIKKNVVRFISQILSNKQSFQKKAC